MDKQTPGYKNDFPALTGVRGIAAFMVFFGHLPLHLYFPMFQYIQTGFSITLTMFFVLSGFVITYTYYPTFTLSGKWFKAYFVKRIARLYPVYYLLLTIVIIAKGNYNLWYLIKNYTLTHSLFNIADVAVGPSWSLTVEECFYIIAPLIMLSAKRISIWLPLAIYSLILAAILMTRNNQPDIFTANFYMFMLTIVGRFFEFFIGAFAALYLLRRSTDHKKGIGFTTVGSLGILTCMTIIALQASTHLPIKSAFTVLMYNFLLPFPVIILYYGLIRERTWLSKWFSTKTWILFGKASYVFYLLHSPLIDAFRPQLNVLKGLGYNLLVLLLFLITTLLSALIYTYYEVPLHRNIKKWLLK